jgi:hypothetical protein
LELFFDLEPLLSAIKLYFSIPSHNLDLNPRFALPDEAEITVASRNRCKKARFGLFGQYQWTASALECFWLWGGKRVKKWRRNFPSSRIWQIWQMEFFALKLNQLTM